LSVYSSFEVGDKSKALVQVEVILNPLTETAQKWSTMLRVSLSCSQKLQRSLKV
jgi:hypothetical protein